MFCTIYILTAMTNEINNGIKDVFNSLNINVSSELNKIKEVAIYES